MTDDATPDPDLQALMDRVLAAIKQETRGYELDGLIVVLEVDGRGVTVGVDLDEAEAVVGHLERVAHEIRRYL